MHGSGLRIKGFWVKELRLEPHFELQFYTNGKHATAWWNFGIRP